MRPLILALLFGCSFDSTPDSSVGGGSLTVSGDVVDFQRGTTVSSGVTVAVFGFAPSPPVEVSGSTFTITEVPESSVFELLAAGSGYRPTFSPAIEVKTDDLVGLKIPTVRGEQIDAIAAAFGITPSAANGIV